MLLHIEARFEPQSDITAYELAVIVQKLPGYRNDVIRFTTAQWNDLDESIKRHFVKDV
jgi:hypothetical protein